MSIRRLTAGDVVTKFARGMSIVNLAIEREKPRGESMRLGWAAGPEGQAAIQRIEEILRRAVRRGNPR